MPKAYVSGRKFQRNYICIMTLKGDAKFKGKLTVTGGLKNDIKNLVNFHASSRKSENLLFDVQYFSIA